MTLRSKLLDFYWGMERRIVPGLKYSQHRYEEHLERWVLDGVDWLDVGCGRRLLPDWRMEGERRLLARVDTLVGIDLDLSSLKENTSADFKIFASVGQLPFRDESFDLVTANMVIEHLEDPTESLTEVARVLKHKGLFLFHTPNASAFPTAVSRLLPDLLKAPLARMLDGRRSMDVFKTYYRCNSQPRIAECAKTAGLEMLELSFVSTTALFSTVPPLAFLELLWLRSIQGDTRRQRRSNLIAVLRKE
jgi:ubiquinone/menaquinone biosynthesis C-methylase UbiE